MTEKVIFNNFTCSSWEELDINANTVMFHGKPVDDRGASVLDIEDSPEIIKTLIDYDFEEMVLTVGEVKIFADKSKDSFKNLVMHKNVVLEATTLGFPELFLTIKALIELKVDKFFIVYVEPEDYNRTKKNGDDFDL